MACDFLNLNSCEIRGATYQGRRIDFVNKDISQDVFTAKAYDKNGYLVSEFTGLKSGSVVYFPFSTLQNIQSDKFIIKYWANFPQLGNIQIANEKLIVSNDCKSCKSDNKAIPYTLKLINETVKFTLSFEYIAIGSNGDVDLTEYLKKTDADNKYQPKGNYAPASHTHSYNDLSDKPDIPQPIDVSNKADTNASNIDEHIDVWKEKLGVGSSIASAVENDSLVVGETVKDALDSLGGEIDTEIVNRALADNSLQSQITTEKNRNDTQDGRITANETAITDLSLNQIEITTTSSITTNTLGTITGKSQHMRSVLVKNGVNAINITLEASSNAKFEAIYYKKGSGAITFVAGAGVNLVKVANDGILNGAIDSNALVYRDGNTFYLYISNY